MSKEHPIQGNQSEESTPLLPGIADPADLNGLDDAQLAAGRGRRCAP